MSIQFAVDAHSLSKTYQLDHEPALGLKNQFVNMLHLRGRTKSENFEVLKNISFTVERGDSFAIFGGNGAGKSTLLQLIAGTIPPTSGKLTVNGSVAPIIELGVGFQIDLTGEENVYLQASLFGMRNAYTRSIFDEIVEFSGLGNFIDVPVKTYSLGMYMRLAFSIAIHLEPDILLADEILGVGDFEFHEKCVAKIKDMHNEGMTIILVTHSIPQAKAVCRRFIVLNNGEICDQGLLSER